MSCYVEGFNYWSNRYINYCYITIKYTFITTGKEEFRMNTLLQRLTEVVGTSIGNIGDSLFEARRSWYVITIRFTYVQL
jgi:hypothetical protein